MTNGGDGAWVPSGSHWGIYDARVEDGRVVAVRPFEADPDPSRIIESMPAIVHNEARVAEPMVRKGWLDHGPGGGTGAGRGVEPFVPVSWSQALDLVAGEIARIRETFGNEAIYGGNYGWSSAGRLHHAKTLAHRFFGLAGGYTYSVQTYSFAAGQTIAPHVLGSMQPVVGAKTDWRSMERHTKLMVMFGGVPLKNTQIDGGGCGEHGTAGWLREMKRAGCEFVCFGPVRDDAPAFVAAEWLPIRPNTDVAVMLGLAHTLVAEGLHDKEFLARYCTGFERFEPYLTGAADGRPKDAAWAADIAGIDAEDIRDLARRMASSRTMINVSWSLQRAHHGEQPFWMVVTLAAMLGQIGLPGGGFGFGYGATDGMGRPRRPVPPPAVPMGRNPVPTFIPVARIADMLLEPGAEIDFNGSRIRYPDIRMIYWAGGNPFHHHQDLNKLRRGWAKPETVVVHEPWWTAAARHADIVLPATTTLERNDIGASPHDRWLFAMKKAVEPVASARNDFDIFADLAQRLGFADAFTEGRSEGEWLRHIYDVARQQAAEARIEMPDFDVFWRLERFALPAPQEPFVLFEDFRADPDAEKLKTPSGKIEIYSETIAGFGYDDCPGHPTWMEPVEWLGADQARTHPLHLISNQPRTRLHSQTDCGSVSRGSKIEGREPIWVHPDDAAARGIGNGDVVRVFNHRGACLAGVVVTADVRPGVVQLATGAWYDPEDGRPGALDKHGNPNVLTLDMGASKLSQAPVAHSALVEIERFEGALPAITAFTPPATVEA